jgi:sortase A
VSVEDTIAYLGFVEDQPVVESVEDQPVVERHEVVTVLDAPSPPGPGVVAPAGADVARSTDVGGLAKTVVGWLLGTLVGIIIVLYALSPLFQQRDQHKLLASYRMAIREASLQATGLFGTPLPTEPPATGSAVGILQIGRLHLQEVVTEGVGPAQTAKGPGHVPGTAGLGQPGNTAVVARRSAFGGPFAGLTSLRSGDPIVVTTTEGQSLYVVSEVRSVTLTAGTTASSPSLGLGQAQSSSPEAPARLTPSIGVDNLYGASGDNRLTLVTSDSLAPWNASTATVVVATMKTTPFTPTPQQARSASEDGRSAASGAWAPLVLALLAFGLVAWGAVFIYRRGPLRTAYLISTAPLVVATILLAVALSRLLPAWD